MRLGGFCDVEMSASCDFDAFELGGIKACGGRTRHGLMVDKWRIIVSSNLCSKAKSALSSEATGNNSLL